MINFLYDSWMWFAAASAAVGLISGIIALFRKQGSWEIIQEGILAGILIAIILASCFVGQAFTKVPDLQGRTLRDAVDELDESFLVVSLQPGVKQEDNWQSIVVGQSIDKGETILKGAKITVYLKSELTESSEEMTVSQASSCSIVPNVVGMEQLEGIEVLQNAGLSFQVWWTEEHNIEADTYYIIGQSIDEGAEVDSGTVIKLELSPNMP